MKSILILGVAALATLATPAAAQDSASVDVIGSAEAFCSLPSTWQFASSTNNVSASQFSGNTWTIPSALVADSAGNAVQSTAEVAIRVRGQAACNTTHTITVTSSNGGLAHDASSGSPPAGFVRMRRMTYNANWRDQSWGVLNFVPSAPGDSRSYDHGSRVPPGVRDFDVRMGLLRDPTNAPMLAGTYTDQLTITISVAG